MYSKQHEIEGIVEDLIEETIIDALASSLHSVKECEVAVEILKEKLDELDLSVFKELFE